MPESPAASPWPPLVAVGLAVAEAGVLFGVFAVAVGGVSLFGGAVAGFVTESNHSTRPRALAGTAAVLGSVGALVAVATSYQTRGEAVLVGAGLLVGLAVVDGTLGRRRRPV